MKNLLLLLSIATILSCSKNDELSRQTSNDVPQIQIGSQIWAKQNLDVSTYRNGDTIPQVTDPMEWSNLTTGAWCYYNNDPELGKIYGKLYNWYALTDTRELAPEGWKIPSDSDWNILSNYLGGDSIAGGKLKSTGTNYWLNSNYYGTNDYGFDALPSGCRGEDGTFAGLGLMSIFRNSDSAFTTDCGGINPRYLGKGKIIFGETFMNGRPKGLFIANTEYFYGVPVRCLKN
jgi:uncharacterized protein (TIGR02145 family)